MFNKITIIYKEHSKKLKKGLTSDQLKYFWCISDIQLYAKMHFLDRFQRQLSPMMLFKLLYHYVTL